MKQQLQYYNVLTEAITVVSTQEFPVSVSATTLDDWQQGLQDTNLLPPECQSDVIAEDEDGFISGGL